eukprot:4293532-Pleurochrysis_carterae.AAC.1
MHEAAFQKSFAEGLGGLCQPAGQFGAVRGDARRLHAERPQTHLDKLSIGIPHLERREHRYRRLVLEELRARGGRRRSREGLRDDADAELAAVRRVAVRHVRLGSGGRILRVGRRLVRW